MSKSEYGKNVVIVLEQKIVKSKPWLKLTGASTQVYLIFRTKCQMKRIKAKVGRSSGMSIVNNGEIVFTYKDAYRKYGISKDRFQRAIDQLVEFGFIDISHTTNGLHKVETQYAISDRWKNWGTDAFVPKKRERRLHGPGFKKGNDLWRLRKKQQVKTRITPCAKTIVNPIRELKVMRTNAHGIKLTTLFKYRNDKWLEQKAS